MRSKCFGEELPPLSNFIQTKNFFLLGAERPRYEFSATSVHSFVPIFSLYTQQDCVLPVGSTERPQHHDTAAEPAVRAAVKT